MREWFREEGNVRRETENIGGHHHNRNGPTLANPGGQLHSIDNRHVQIRKHQIRRILLELLLSIWHIKGLSHPIPGRLQDTAHEPAHLRVIFNDENCGHDRPLHVEHHRSLEVTNGCIKYATQMLEGRRTGAG